MTDYTHLHVHSHFSLMDGLNTPKELLEAAKDMGQSALAITDHGTLAGHRDLQKAALEAGMKPILGVEAYISETDRFDRRTKAKRSDGTGIYNHIILLAKNQAGVRNLNKLSEVAWNEGYYYKPRIDFEVLNKYGDGLIVLSGCMSGLISKSIEREDEENALYWTSTLKGRFGDDFFMEVQPHNPPELNSALFKIADDMSVPVVTTSDCHFAREDQRAVEEALLILSTGAKYNSESTYEKSKGIKNLIERFNYLYPDRPISFADINVFVQNRLDIEGAWQEQGIDRTDIYENTKVITDRVEDYEFHNGLDLLPLPKYDPQNRLVTLCNQGLKRLGLADDENYKKRLQLELDIINNKNFAPYFLIVANTVSWAKGEGIVVGPGRGSAAGSLVCYTLGITEVDPLEYGLLFARFLNEERNDYPDIDIDFMDTRRGEVKEYMKRKFGNVAGISTFNTFKDKNVIKDAARVFRVPYGDTERALKTISTFEDFGSTDRTQEYDRAYPEVMQLASKLRGRVRGVGMHAAGVVLSNKPLWNYVPLETRDDKDSKVSGRIPVVALDMEDVEKVGLIKIDLLGLKNLSVLDTTVKLIKDRHNKDIDRLKIPLDDKAVFADLSNGFTQGVFQAEQMAYTNLLMEMGVESFEDIVASNALVRPGAMNTVGAQYIARKSGRQNVNYVHEIMEPITRHTYGSVIYQEQVMQTVVELAGMSWSDADHIRKIIGKKKDVREFDAYKAKFIEGASKHIPAETAERLWHDFEAHSGYSFNRSHAVAYSLITYWTAWLKHYYPLEFMTAALRHENDGDKITEYLIEAKRLNIPVMLPHINDSGLQFQINGDHIQFGLLNIKNMVENAAEEIIHSRPYTEYAELMKQFETKGNPVNKKVIDALNAVGAARLPDNDEPGDKSNWYEYLNIPMFSTEKISPKIMRQVTKFEDYDESGVFVVVGLAKKIKRGEGWSRIDFIDATGKAGIFHTQNTGIESGQMYLMLVSDNRIARYINVNEIGELQGDVFLHWLEVDEIRVEPHLKVVISAEPRVTKNNKRIINLVVSDQEKHLQSVLVFSKNFARGLGFLKPGMKANLALKRLDDGTLFVEEIKNVV